LHSRLCEDKRIETDVNLIWNAILQNSSAGVVSVEYFNVSPTYFMSEEEKRQLRGFVGWAGSSGGPTVSGTVPLKALGIKFHIEDETMMNRRLCERLLAIQRTFAIHASEIAPRRVEYVKAVHFDQILNLMQQHNANTTESDLTFVDEERLGTGRPGLFGSFQTIQAVPHPTKNVLSFQLVMHDLLQDTSLALALAQLFC